MSVDLKAIRERDAKCAPGGGGWSPAVSDRRQLLALVDRMTLVVRRANCAVECRSLDRRAADDRTCDCGLDALLRELDAGGER